MREILFRGKPIHDRSTLEWIEGGIKTKDGRAFIIGMSSKMRVEAMEVSPDTVGQYTGLTDKNGQKIFEGDILRGWSSLREKYYYVGPVEYGEFNCSCCDGVYGWYIRNGDIRVFDGGNSGLEVIGNIHDNKELLDGSEV